MKVTFIVVVHLVAKGWFIWWLMGKVAIVEVHLVAKGKVTFIN